MTDDPKKIRQQPMALDETLVQGDGFALDETLSLEQAPGLDETLDAQDLKLGEAETMAAQFGDGTIPLVLPSVTVRNPHGLLRETDQFHGQRIEPVGLTVPTRRLHHALENAIQYQQAALVGIGGDAGSGKTRLAFEFLRSVNARPDRIRALQCIVDPSGSETSYASVRHLLWGLLFPGGSLESAAAEVIFEHALEKLTHNADITAVTGLTSAMLQAGLMHVLDIPVKTVDPLDEFVASPQAYQQVVFQAVTGLIRIVAEETPCLIVIDDAHYLDGDSMELLHHLVAGFAVARTSLALVLTHSPSPPPSLTGLLTTAGAEKVRLAPLADADARLLATRLLVRLGTPPSGFIDSLVQLSDGNPQKLIEFTNYHIDSGGIEASGSKWHLTQERLRVPPTLEASITERVNQLPVEEQRILRMAAVIGRSFWSGLLANLTGGRPEPTLARLQNRGYLVEQPAVPAPEGSAWTFVQGVVHDTLYQLYPAEERIQIHRATVAWLEQHRTGGRFPAELLAEHAARALLYQQAAGYYIEAAREAAGNLAFNAQVGNLVKALKYADRKTAQELRLSLGEAYRKTGRLDLAGETLQTLLADPEITPSYVHQAQLCLASVLCMRGEAEDAVPLSESLLEVIAGGGVADVLHLKILTTAMQVRVKLGSAKDALQIRMPWQGEALRERSTDPDFSHKVVDFYKMQANALLLSGKQEAARQVYVTAMRFAKSARDRLSIASLETNIGSSHFFEGDYGKAAEHYRRARRMVERVGHSYGLAIICSNLGETCWKLGRLEEAEAELTRSFELSTALAFKELLPETQRLLAEIAFSRDDLGQAQTLAKAARTAAERIGHRQFLAETGMTLARVVAARALMKRDRTLAAQAHACLVSARETALQGGLKRESDRVTQELAALKRDLAHLL